jgi:predicted ATPase
MNLQEAPPAPSDGLVPFVTRVRITNYKSIARCDVALGPFTVLLGLNAAGKSNFLDALRFVRDAVVHGPGEAVASRGGLGEVVRRVPERARFCAVSLDCQVLASPDEGGDERPVRARYEFTLAAAEGHPERPRIEREECTIGPPHGPPQAWYRVVDGVLDDHRPSQRGGTLRRGGLYLPLVAVSEPYAQLHEALTSMFFYEPVLASLRDARPDTGRDLLDEDGGQLGAVLARLGEWERERVSAYAGAIVPHLTEVGPTAPGGDYVAARMTTATGPGGTPQAFRAEAMSEGTIRAIGLLATLFQPGARDGRIPLLAVEEPELALHPMAAGVLFDALTEASGSAQVLATTQSAELFDRKEADLSAILVATADDGVTTIGPVDAVSRSIVADGLATVGELLRSDQLRPEAEAEGEGA